MVNTDFTIEKLSDLAGLKNPQELLKKLSDAGIVVKDPQQISDSERKKILAFIKNSLEAEKSMEAPKKITLTRQKVSELKVTTSQGQRKTVQVKVRAKRTYVNVKPQEETAQESAPETIESNKIAAEAPAQQSEISPPPVEVTEPTKTKKGEVPETPKVESAKAPKETPKEKETPAKKSSKKGFDATKEKEGAHKAKPHLEADTKRAKTKWLKEIQTLGEEDEVVPTKRLSIQVDERRKRKVKKEADTILGKHGFERPVTPMVHEVLIPESITVADLAQRMSLKGAVVIRALMKMGTMVTINQAIDQDTAVLIVEELGHKPKLQRANELEESILTEETTAEKVTRPPVVTIMGHVDHGKTSLLDFIRRTKVASGEAGGITQHIGAYHVETPKGTVTFLDTPGHAAFTAMRARGAKVTDIVILVVAADDGVMPQTIEAIQHARAGNAPIIVAINKMDKEDADPDRVMNELTQHNVVPEAWGGDTMVVKISAKAGTGIDELLDSILLQAEILDLKAPVNIPARGVVIESSLDKGRGPVATILVQQGTLRRGDLVLAGTQFGHVRALLDELGQKVESAGPSIPVVVLGLSAVPSAGDDAVVLADERKAREVATQRLTKERDTKLSRAPKQLEGIFDRLGEGEQKVLNVLLKADVQGSAEALSDALNKLSIPEAQVRIISAGVGGITESDVHLAIASNAVIFGFNVRADAVAKRIIAQEGAILHYYSVIYDVINEVKSVLSGMLAPEIKETILGTAEVRDVFRSSKFGAIAGCMVIEGILKRNKKIRVLRDNVVIYEGELESLRRFKEDAAEVRAGMECGIGVKNYNDIKVGDHIEVFETVSVARTL